ncbi:MAG: thioredoxin family protein [Crocinitomicaceae bacterium]|nr:thioredoxin family protein [Crocinitomicaceae bacterium]
MLISTDIRPRLFSYYEFLNYIEDLFEKGLVTGAEQNDDKLVATKLNLARLNRINKTIELDDHLIELVRSLDVNWQWVLIMEGWCGDGAQIAPYINKLSELNDKINLQIVLRDENPEIMNNYLTNGTKSIPILICIDESTDTEVGHWGPRPKAVIEWVKKYKEENPGFSSNDFKKGLHSFYTKDKGGAICNDLYKVISSWKNLGKKSG